MTVPTVLMEEMTWPEVERAIAGGVRTAILACGATEQHGPHLPLGTDAYLGTAIAERAARIAGDALVAPTLRPGLSEHHMHFPGSLTLRPETFVALLGDYCTSLARHGFTRIVIFPSHGGNADMMRAWMPTLARPLAGRCELVLSVRAAEDMQRTMAVLSELGVTPGRAGVHAGYVETAMMLSAFAHLVRMDRAEPGRCDKEFYQPERLHHSQMQSFLFGVPTHSPHRGRGDPTGATAAAGDRLLDIVAQSLARDVARPNARTDYGPAAPGVGRPPCADRSRDIRGTGG